MASPAALLALLALVGAHSQPDLCKYETNRIKDLLQASCEGQGLTQVPPGLDKDIGILLLGSNSLARVSTAAFAPLHNLTDLDLSRNGLGELTASSPLPRLQELELSRNALKELPTLRAFPGLVRLALGHNALTWLPEGGFRPLGRLVDLELQGNRLRSLPEGAFAGLAALKDLDLSDNHLAALPPELLAGLGALETLRLERNRLRSVPEDFFREGHFYAYVYLGGNPWLCDCALEYLRMWIADNEFSVYTRVQGPEKEITENQPENVTCQDPPEELGHPVMTFSRDCGPESGRGSRGDEEESAEPQGGPATLGPHTPHDKLSAPPFLANPTAALTQPEPLSTTPALPTSKATSPARAAHSPWPTTQGPLATSPPTARDAQAAPTTSTSGLPPASTPATPGAPPSTPPQAAIRTQSMPVPTTTALVLPATMHPGFAAHPMPPPPAYCQCPILPGVALGLTGQQPSPASWGAWLAARCCPLRLALCLACLVLVSVPTLAAVGWWACVCTGSRHPQTAQHTLGSRLVRYQQLQNVAGERHHVPREGCQGLPRRCLYRVCKRLEIAPLRYITWLLISLPGPSGQWPWERKGSFDQGKDHLRAKRGNHAPATL